jgi:hypothetical protein
MLKQKKGLNGLNTPQKIWKYTLIYELGLLVQSHESSEMLGRSSRTLLMQIQRHNMAVERSGFCPVCKRVKGGYCDKMANRKNEI